MSTEKLNGARSRAKEYVHDNMKRAYANAQAPSAIEIDGWVYLTGVIAAPQEGESDLEPAFIRAFEQLTEVLKMAGCSWDDVIKITSFHKDAGAQLEVVSKIKKQFVKHAPYPAWTIVGTNSLANPAGVCEIEVIAKK